MAQNETEDRLPFRVTICPTNPDFLLITLSG